MQLDLVPIWTVILGVGVFMYVLLDGFDLGVGILFPFAADEDARSLMMNSVAPIWDGNETWLVLGGAGLLVAFPLAYAVIMSGLYLPIIIMLLGLVFRGVAFEFRWAAKPKHHLWDNAFAWGSIVATFMQGVVLGGFLQGIVVENKAFAGGPLDWFAPFPLFTGLALLVGYALLGATWL
ncbi:MAG: cytochrome d ubiquinol oxidase subunit II, partial [Casimicrobiaceae bacterium]